MRQIILVCVGVLVGSALGALNDEPKIIVNDNRSQRTPTPSEAIEDPVVRQDIVDSKLSTREKMTGPSAYQLRMATPEEQEAEDREVARMSADEWCEAFMSSDPMCLRERQRARRYDKRLTEWKRSRAQGVMLARMAASEAVYVLWDTDVCLERDDRKVCGTGGEVGSDAVHIAWTVVHNRGAKSKFRGWLDVMRFLSPHVTRSKELTRPRQEWTSTLPAHGKAKPSGWVDERDGDWRLYAENWAAFRDNMVEMWVHHSMPQVAGKPRAWGNEADVQRGMARRGMCLLPCEGCSNGFLARPGEGCEVEAANLREIRVLPAAVAAARRERIDGRRHEHRVD